MVIVYDLLFSQPLGKSKFHGGGEYIKTVFRFLVENYSSSCRIIGLYDYDRFIDDWLKRIIEEYSIETINVKNAVEVSEYLSSNCVDTFFSGLAYAYESVKLPNKIRRIGTIHGLRTLEMPCDQYTAIFTDQGVIRYIKDKIKYKISRIPDNIFEKREREKFVRVFESFDQIITVSNHSKFAISCWFGETMGNRTRVFYTPNKFALNDRFDERGELPEQFVLLLGGNRWIKNIARSILAIEELLDANQLNDYSFVVCGTLPPKVKKLICHPERYILLEYVPSEILEKLYRYCDFMMYLTLNEGFGMPPLEAMNYGKTVITSPICSIPEVCGDAVYYANPYDLKEIQNRILQASKKKISEQKVKERFEYIKSLQQKDLIGVCEFILKGGE